MNATKGSAESRIREVVKLIVRYISAVLVAWLVSVSVMLIASGTLVGVVPFLTDSNPERHAVVFAIAYSGSFAGVFAGSLFGRDRRLGAVALSLLGLGFYWAYCDRFNRDPELAGVASRPLLLALSLGSSTAILLATFAGRNSRKSAQV